MYTKGPINYGPPYTTGYQIALKGVACRDTTYEVRTHSGLSPDSRQTSVVVYQVIHVRCDTLAVGRFLYGRAAEKTVSY